MALKEYNRLQIRKTPSVCVQIYYDLKINENAKWGFRCEMNNESYNLR